MKPKSTLQAFLAVVSSSLLAISSASAQTTYTWDISGAGVVTGGTGDWNTTNSLWTTDAGATNVSWDADNSNNDTAIFGAVAGVSTVTLGEAIDIRTLTINSVTSANRYTIQGSTLNFSTGGTITWNSTNSSNFVDVSSINSAITGAPAVTGAGTGGNTQFVFAPSSGSQTLGKLGGVSIYRLAGSTTGNSFTGTADATGTATKIIVSSGASWTLTGAASGYEHTIGGTLFITGSGSLRNSSRDTVLSSTGILHWNTASAIIDGTISTGRDRDFRIDGGSIDNTSGAAITSNQNPQMRWNGNWTFIGSNGANSNLNMGTGDVFITGATRQVTVTNAATTLTVGGAIAGSGFGLTKAGAGTLSLSGSGANTYNGTTTINGGTLALGKTAGVNAIAGAITLGDGATTAGNDILRLNASNQIADTAVINFNAATGANAGIFRLNNQSETVAGIASTGGGGIIENESGSAATSTLTVNNAATQSFSGIIRDGDGSGTDGTLALTKTGSGTLTLTNTNTYTGATNINAGTLAITGTGTINSSSSISIAAGGTLRYNSSTALTVAPTLAGAGISNRAVLGGTGPINVAITLDDLGDVLSPGNSPGIQNHTVDQTWSSFSYDWEVNNFTGTTAGTDFDQITGTAFTLNGSAGSYILNVIGLDAGNVAGLTPNFSEINRTWTILTSSGTSTFNAANWTINTAGFSSPDAGTWTLGQSGNDLVLTYTAIPEPSTALLCSLGLLALLRRRRN